ncbi:HAD family hydrolase [Streptomyces sp. BPTC-684]|uniref:HAD family hydrolase n=1 Tax=Streptomyces sp. BPTC-684 TaxID=3043734 RepID=UPI0024B0C744|nr:HAD family hydrolase [Streptomyces sp. BPTC-684]WHM41123.1 HAD family hydrolase [Streptomyces sp. BPTC-684]
MRLALFDLDNTLINRQWALADWARAFCADHGLDTAAQRHITEVLRERAYSTTFERLRQELALQEPAAQLWDGYVAGIAARVPRSPDVLAGLEQLRTAGWRLGILTNGASDIQRAKITAAGLTDAVDAIVISEEIGIRKPEVDAFHVAVARTGGTPSARAWMVGDNPAGDIGGAHQAGLSTIWLRGRPWPDGVPAPHHTVDTATEAITLLLTGSAS